MEFTAQLDVDVVALEAEDDVTCLISLTAPVPEGLAERPGEAAIASHPLRSHAWRCEGCQARRSAETNAAWQRTHRDAVRAAHRPLKVPRLRAQEVAQEAERALAALAPLESHLTELSQKSRRAAQAVSALEQATGALRQLQELLAEATATAATSTAAPVARRTRRMSDRTSDPQPRV